MKGWVFYCDQGFKTSDGFLVVAAGNDQQFVKVCKVSILISTVCITVCVFDQMFYTECMDETMSSVNMF